MLVAPIYDTKHKVYCGPTAISSITGISVNKIEETVIRIRRASERKRFGEVVKGGSVLAINGRKKSVAGMFNDELIKTMERLNYKLVKRDSSFKGTVGAFCYDRENQGPFVVVISGHYLAVSHGMICDTYSKVPISFYKHPKNRSYVKQIFQFKKRGWNVE